MTKVLIHPADYENIEEAVDRAFDTFPLELKGKKVLIKPNVLRASRAEEGIVTHHSLVRAVVEKTESMGPASITVGHNPGMIDYGANEECFKTTGLMDASRGHYENIGNSSVEVPFDARYMNTVSISKAVMEADVVISLPRFKTHGLTILSGALKNSYGFLPGAQKALLHRAACGQEKFHEIVVDIFKIRIPDLFIMDAVVAMEGNGPASPDLRNVGRVIASDNAVAMDSVVAYMMGLDPGKLRFMQKAKEDGLGSYDIDSMEIIGGLVTIPDYKIPPLGGEAVLDNPGLQGLIDSRTNLTAKADRELCTACGRCVDHCPVSALKMKEDIPVVDPKLCILCFCCQEICPEKAITLI